MAKRILFNGGTEALNTTHVSGYRIEPGSDPQGYSTKDLSAVVAGRVVTPILTGLTAEEAKNALALLLRDLDRGGSSVNVDDVLEEVRKGPKLTDIPGITII
jgi:hypothetical protein